MKAVNIDDLRKTAKRRLPKPIYDYIAGGAYRELTLAHNRADLDALIFRGTTMPGARLISARTRSSFRTMAGVSWTVRHRQSRCCRKSRARLAARSRCCGTAES